VKLTRCPTGEITPESLEDLEHWRVARMFGFGDIAALPARTVDAFCTFENESAREKSHDERRME
jgi:hypothetical protein